MDDRQTGNRQTGNGQTGDGETGNGQTGNRQTGKGETGNRQTGDRQTGNGQTGKGQTGNRQTGNMQTGKGQTGKGQTGNRQIGDRLIGDRLTGNRQIGDRLTGNGETGSRRTDRPVALVTGASRGLGRALAGALADRGWALVIDARGAEALHVAARQLALVTTVVALPGDVADEGHRADLVAAARGLGRLDALVHNASVLGPSPQPALAEYPLDVLEHVYAVNVLAPLRLTQMALPLLGPGACVVAVTSDAAVEAYEGWGGYGSSKAALEQLTAVLGAERPELRVYRVDPGDMNTRMHAEAFPGEDISDRPPPEVSVPGLVGLIEGRLPSGRYLARSVTAGEIPVGR